MKNLKIKVASVFFVALVGCGSGRNPEDLGDFFCRGFLRDNACEKKRLCEPPIQSLLVAPQCYNGMKVMVGGFLVHANGEARLYVGREAAENNLTEQSIILYDAKRNEGSKFVFLGKDRYIKVAGFFYFGPGSEYHGPNDSGDGAGFIVVDRRGMQP